MKRIASIEFSEDAVSVPSPRPCVKVIITFADGSAQVARTHRGDDKPFDFVEQQYRFLSEIKYNVEFGEEVRARMEAA